MTASLSHIAGAEQGRCEPADLDDVPKLAALGELLHATSNHRSLSFNRTKVEKLLAHLISDPNGVVFVTREAGEIVGAFAGAVIPNWFGEDLVGVDYSFFVKPEARKDLRGTTLILAFVRWCERRGARQVKVGITTGIEVESTSRLYRSLGFVDAGIGFLKELNYGNC